MSVRNLSIWIVGKMIRTLFVDMIRKILYFYFCIDMIFRTVHNIPAIINVFNTNQSKKGWNSLQKRCIEIKCVIHFFSLNLHNFLRLVICKFMRFCL